MARLAESEERWEDADGHYRSILLEVDRNHTAAYEALCRLHKSHPDLIGYPGNERIVRDRLGRSFRRLVTPNFVIYSNADDAWTQRQAGRLERAEDEFTRFCHKLELNPLPLGQRLLCILFDDQTEYAAFARRYDGIEARWIAGYYAPKENYVVFFNEANGASFADAGRKVDEQRRQITEIKRELRDAQLKRQHDYADHLRSELRRFEQALATNEQMIDDAARNASASKTIHEAVHLLAANMGVMSRYRRHPFWLTEGLATAFETQRPEQAFGPAHEQPIRREGFEALLDSGEILPLAQFVSFESVPNEDQAIASVMYQQSYALFQYLYRYQRDDLAAALRRSGQPGPNTINHVADFERHFGGIDAFERVWIRRERNR